MLRTDRNDNYGAAKVTISVRLQAQTFNFFFYESSGRLPLITHQARAFKMTKTVAKYKYQQGAIQISLNTRSALPDKTRD